MKSKLIVLISLLLLFYGCEKNATDPDENSDVKLTDAEQIDIVAAEVATNNGGVMADMALVSSVSKGGFSGLNKPASYDTTFTKNWITYSLSLAFYTAQGMEQIFYIPNLTDKIIYNGSMIGHDSTNKREIDLNKTASFVITGITSGVLTINGSATNNSSYEFSGRQAELTADVESSLIVTNLIIDKNSNSYIPQSGKIECTFHGTYTREGTLKEKNVVYSFNVTIEFTGGTQVKVTLPSGNQFTLNIVTGDVS